MAAKLKLEDFITKCNLKHNNKFSYDKVVLINTQIKIIITCPIHGDFEQKANNHLRGQGCSKCYGNIKYTKEEFIDKSNIIHNNQYCYEYIKYGKSSDKIEILCDIHGIFPQTPKDHLAGYGCPQCGIKKNSKNRLKKINDFVKEANSIHSNRYTYENVNYKGTCHLVEITCPIHGNYKQKPSDHLSGCGCPSCTKSGYKSNKKGYLYIQSISNNTYKIGITNNPTKRLEQVNNKSIHNHIYYKLYSSDDGKLISIIERKILKEIPTGVISKNDMKDGYTETFSSEYIEKVLHLIEIYNLQEEII